MPQESIPEAEAPTAALPAFHYFSRHVRAELASSSVTRLSFGELSEKVAERWGSITPAERAHFDDVAGVAGFDLSDCGVMNLTQISLRSKTYNTFLLMCWCTSPRLTSRRPCLTRGRC